MSLSDFRGSRVVLYFYPKADTPGCTTQACGIRDHRADYEAAGAVVLGVSPDPVKAIKKFADKQSLDFRLLADEDHAVCETYGVWAEKSMYGRTFWGALRSTFVIDERGRRAPRDPEGVAEDARRRGARAAGGDDSGGLAWIHRFSRRLVAVRTPSRASRRGRPDAAGPIFARGPVLGPLRARGRTARPARRPGRRSRAAARPRRRSRRACRRGRRAAGRSGRS